MVGKHIQGFRDETAGLRMAVQLERELSDLIMDRCKESGPVVRAQPRPRPRRAAPKESSGTSRCSNVTGHMSTALVPAVYRYCCSSPQGQGLGFRVWG
jgi:hypothetical protein